MNGWLSFLCFLLCISSCKTAPPPSPCSNYFSNNGKVKVLSTTAMIDDLVGQIGKGHVDHLPLVTAQLDPHSYELVKGDDEKIAFADLFIGNGLNLEHGASVRFQLDSHPRSLYLAEEIRKRVPDRILAFDAELDPHLWMDISVWSEGIDPIVEALSDIDPNNAQQYRRNGDALRQKMLFVHREIQHQMRQVPEGMRYLVTSHDAFRYFTKAYLCNGTEIAQQCVAPEGLAPEGQLSIQDIQRVVDHLGRYRIGVVFTESNVNRDALKKIVASCKHPVRISAQSLYGDAMGEAGSGADTYLSMMQHNAEVLKEEWNKRSKSSR